MESRASLGLHLDNPESACLRDSLRTITYSYDSTSLGTFLEEVRLEEPLLKQQHCDLEETALREAILGKPNMVSLPLGTTDPEMDEEIDLTTIPSLEEYR